ncbi:hypothetical protein FOZ62_019207 [Perkinsus olseni]|uniref:Uncharacterized protein n=1 Tax=Perkinsus olseni TaxID=32597 RepID=A0A7J6R3S1_PEROL|nr:hypothetical protein FOZ62_019207 [Perkinsus olseni]
MARQGLFNLVVDLKTTNSKFEDASLPLELRYLVMQYIGRRDPLSFVIPDDDGEVKFLCGECNADESNKFDVWLPVIPITILKLSGREAAWNTLRYDCAYMIAPSDDGGSLLWELNVFTKVWREVRRLDYVPVETVCFDVIRYGDELRVAAVDDGGRAYMSGMGWGRSVRSSALVSRPISIIYGS